MESQKQYQKDEKNERELAGENTFQMEEKIEKGSGDQFG